MTTFFTTTHCLIKTLPLSNPSQSNFPPPAAAMSGIQLSSLHVDAGSRKHATTDQTDIWSSILSAKEDPNSKADLPPIYIHPLVKLSASSLSHKSLEICTESLGSETGSDGFSSAAIPEEEELDVPVEDEEVGSDPPKFNNYFPTSTRKTRNNVGNYNGSALPPPLPSMSLQMRSRRHDGRLVMEAVSPVAPSSSCFKAERRNGRLILTFSDRNPSDHQHGINNTSNLNFCNEEDREIGVPGNCDVADRGDNDLVRVTSAGDGSRPYVYQYWRYKLQSCKRKRSQLLLLKEPHCIVTS